MKLTVLIDNNTYIDEYYIGEPALSYYIEDENERLLFDTGYSDAFIKNAQAINTSNPQLSSSASFLRLNVLSSLNEQIN